MAPHELAHIPLRCVRGGCVWGEGGMLGGGPAGVFFVCGEGHARWWTYWCGGCGVGGWGGMLDADT